MKAVNSQQSTDPWFDNALIDCFVCDSKIVNSHPYKQHSEKKKTKVPDITFSINNLSMRLMVALRILIHQDYYFNQYNLLAWSPLGPINFIVGPDGCVSRESVYKTEPRHRSHATEAECRLYWRWAPRQCPPFFPLARVGYHCCPLGVFVQVILYLLPLGLYLRYVFCCGRFLKSFGLGCDGSGCRQTEVLATCSDCLSW